MVSNIRQLLIALLGLVTFALLSGCGALAVAALQGAIMGSAFSSPKPHPPRILCEAEDSMGLTYGTLGSSSARDEAMRLMSEHCVNGFVETHRVYHTQSSKVFVACLNADGFPPHSLTCNYVAPEPSPVGFGNYDPAETEW